MEGVASVYYLRDKNGDRYFIDKAPYGIMELFTPKQKHNFYYQGILKMLMDDWEESENKINDTQLNYLSLVDLAKQYHHKVCTTDSCIVYKRNF